MVGIKLPLRCKRYDVNIASVTLFQSQREVSAGSEGAEVNAETHGLINNEGNQEVSSGARLETPLGDSDVVSRALNSSAERSVHAPR